MLKAEDSKETDPTAREDSASAPDPNGLDHEAAPDIAAAEELVDPALSEVDSLIVQRECAIEEKNELLDKYLRAQAEFDNARKRLQKEADDIRQYASMSIIESMLPIADDFERAFNAANLDSDVRTGLELIYERMFETFRRAGLKPVEASGSFDPHLHYAVERAPAEIDEDDQKILEVYQQGYHFKDRLLRPAMVKVAVKE